MKNWLLFFILFIKLINGWSQNAETNRIKVEHADNYSFQINGKDQVQTLFGHVVMSHNEAVLHCDSATILNESQVEANANIVITQGDSVTIYADQLNYNAETETAKLLGNVVLVSDNKKLFTSSLTYQLNTKVAEYKVRSSIQTDSIVLSSESGIYWVNNKEAHFYSEVYVEHEDFQLFSDTVRYNFDIEVASFLGPSIFITKDSTNLYAEGGSYDQKIQFASFFDNAIYTDSIRIAQADSILYWQLDQKTYLSGNASIWEADRQISGDSIYIDQLNKQFNAKGSAQVIDQSQVISAYEIRLDDILGRGWATGEVNWVDTSAGMRISCDTAHLTNHGLSIQAYNQPLSRPLLALNMEGDTLYLGADTLFAISQVDSSNKDTIRTFLAFHDVRIFKSDLQLICDSLEYSEKEERFSFYEKPILWSDTSAFYGDSIFMFLLDKTVDHLELSGNGFMINSADEILFNQIKGRVIDILFLEGDIHKVKVNGNAETIYYVLDEENAYIGVNQSSSSNMVIQFKEGEVDAIKNYNEVESYFIPIQEADQEVLKLEGFRWDNTNRPNGIFSLITTKRL
ncbi:MAG: OstA-like protein [Saprospiraceae bacterium]|jgi:lipopolysaccharide export system protein LptA